MVYHSNESPFHVDAEYTIFNHLYIMILSFAGAQLVAKIEKMLSSAGGPKFKIFGKFLDNRNKLLKYTI